MQLIAQTPRFLIRNFEASDEETYLSLFNDAQVLLHIPKRTRTENIVIFHSALKDYIAGETLGRWGLFNNGNNDFIGLCLLRSFNDEGGIVELGYVLSRKYWGRGIASELAHIMVAYGFKHAGAKEIVAVTTLENIPSQRVLEKAGLTRMDNLTRDGREIAFFKLSRDTQ